MMAVVLAFASLAALGVGHLHCSKGAPAVAGNGGCGPANSEFHTSASGCISKIRRPNWQAWLRPSMKCWSGWTSRSPTSPSFPPTSPTSSGLLLRIFVERLRSPSVSNGQPRIIARSWLRVWKSIRKSPEVIDRLLFLALAERSEGCLERKMVNVGDELMSIAGFFEPAATEMNLGIQLAANGDLCMSADPVLVRRAVCNLVSNAIAHTPPGGTIGLAAYKQKSAIRVIVADSGTGIPAEHLPHVFDRFYRVNRTPRGQPGRSRPGTQYCPDGDEPAQGRGGDLQRARPRNMRHPGVSPGHGRLILSPPPVKSQTCSADKLVNRPSTRDIPRQF